MFTLDVDMFTPEVDMSQNPVIGPSMQSWDQAFVAAAYSAALVLYCLLTLQHTWISLTTYVNLTCK